MSHKTSGYTLMELAEFYKHSVTVKIRHERKALGLSVSDLAAHCGVTVYAVRSWLYDDVIPERKNLVKLDNLFET